VHNEGYNCFGEVRFFSSCRKFRNRTRAAIEFCIKLQKTATETFKMLKSAYGKECFLEQVCLSGKKGIQKTKNLIFIFFYVFYGHISGT
jgi:hypothetical protein